MFEIMFDDLKPEAQKEFLKYMGIKNPSEGNYEVVPIATIEYNDEEEADEVVPIATVDYNDEEEADEVICLTDEDYVEGLDGCLLVDPNLLDPSDEVVDVSVDYYHDHYRRYRVLTTRGLFGETILDPTGYEYDEDVRDAEEGDE